MLLKYKNYAYVYEQIEEKLNGYMKNLSLMLV